MNTLMVMFCSFSIFITGIAGAIRFTSLAANYKPFIVLVWIGCANELISAFLIHQGYHTSINNNIYILLEGLLFSWQFYKWRVISLNLLILVQGILLAIWFIEFSILPLTRYHSSYSVVHSLIILLCAIKSCSILMVTTDKIATNPQFLITVGSIVFFYFNIVVDTTWVFGENLSAFFRNRIFHIIVYVNVAVNLIFTIAVLWIPEKPKFITS